MQSSLKIKYIIPVLVVILIIVLVVVFTSGGGDTDNDNIDIRNLPPGPYIELTGIFESDQCPSDEQKRIDGMYLPMKANSGLGVVERNGAPIYQSGSGYIIIKNDTGDDYNIYQNEQRATGDERIGYISSSDNRIHINMGCPRDIAAGSVRAANGALTNTVV